MKKKPLWEIAEDAPEIKSGKGHVVSMQTRMDRVEGFLGVAVCECGWRFEEPWESDGRDAAVEAHWNEVGFKPELSE